MKLQQIIAAAGLLRHASAAYNTFKGDGSAGKGWPGMDQWKSFDDLWSGNQKVLTEGCATFNVPNNSPDEVANLKPAIQKVAQDTNMDPRYILAIMLQESNGCLRVHTTQSPDGTVRNPGPFQDHDGDHTCNINGDSRADAMKSMYPQVNWAGGIATPCPADMIEGMIKDGVAGTAKGEGLQQVLVHAAAGLGGPVHKRQATSASSTVALPAKLTTCDAAALAHYSNLVWQQTVQQMQIAYVAPKSTSAPTSSVAAPPPPSPSSAAPSGPPSNAAPPPPAPSTSSAIPSSPPPSAVAPSPASSDESALSVVTVHTKRQAATPPSTNPIPAILSTCDTAALAEYSNLISQQTVKQMQVAYAAPDLTPAQPSGASAASFPSSSVAPSVSPSSVAAPPASSHNGADSVVPVASGNSALPTTLITSILTGAANTLSNATAALSNVAASLSADSAASTDDSDSSDDNTVTTNVAATTTNIHTVTAPGSAPSASSPIGYSASVSASAPSAPPQPNFPPPSSSSGNTDGAAGPEGMTAQQYYRAARLYNSGSVPDPNNLGKAASSTPCYVSDIANRLMGWNDFEGAKSCTPALMT